MRQVERRVVVVDNDPDALDLVVTDLALEGFDVVGCGDSGEAALELCRELEPDAVVVDYRMPPGPTGLDVARRLHAERPAIVVVLYTNYDDRSMGRAAAGIGAAVVAKGNLAGLRRALAP